MVIKADFEMIVHKLPRTLAYVNLYCIGDIHIGAYEFNKELWEDFKRIMIEDANAYCVIAGDLFDCGIMGSKTSTYKQTMMIHEQKEWLEKELGQFAHKILAVVGGNHPDRITKVVGLYPVYDICKMIGVEDCYREYMATFKLNFGAKREDRQWSYTFAVHHGGSKSKKEKFEIAIDGIDGFISGHIHEGTLRIPSKIVVDQRNECISVKQFMSVVVPSFLKFGGYGLEKMYLPQDAVSMPRIELSGTEKRMGLHWD